MNNMTTSSIHPSHLVKNKNASTGASTSKIGTDEMIAYNPNKASSIEKHKLTQLCSDQTSLNI